MLLSEALLESVLSYGDEINEWKNNVENFYDAQKVIVHRLYECKGNINQQRKEQENVWHQ